MEALHKVVAVKDIPGIIQLVGTPWEELGLPEMATVLLDNGQEAEVGIQYWFPDNAYDPEKEFSYCPVPNYPNLKERLSYGVGNLYTHVLRSVQGLRITKGILRIVQKGR